MSLEPLSPFFGYSKECILFPPLPFFPFSFWFIFAYDVVLGRFWGFCANMEYGVLTILHILQHEDEPPQNMKPHLGGSDKPLSKTALKNQRKHEAKKAAKQVLQKSFL